MNHRCAGKTVQASFLFAALSLAIVHVADARQAEKQITASQSSSASTSASSRTNGSQSEPADSSPSRVAQKQSAQESSSASSSRSGKKSSPSRSTSSKKNREGSAQTAASRENNASSSDTGTAAGQAQFESATQVMAELVHGKLSPSSSKPGDTITLKLMQDVKSDGEVLIKKGSTIQGVVTSVSNARTGGKAQGQAQSSAQSSAQSGLAIRWIAPALQGHAEQSLTVALQSVTQVSPFFRQNQEGQAGDDLMAMGASDSRIGATGQAAPSRAPRTAAPGPGLLGAATGTVAQATGSVSGALGSTGQTAGAAGATASSTASSTLSGLGTTGAVNHSGDLSAGIGSAVFQPERVDSQTTTMLQHQLGLRSAATFFRVGQGQIVTAGGDRHQLNLFSEMNNDTVVSSPSKNFEITSGAQMQLLVGVRKQ